MLVKAAIKQAPPKLEVYKIQARLGQELAKGFNWKEILQLSRGDCPRAWEYWGEAAASGHEVTASSPCEVKIIQKEISVTLMSSGLEGLSWIPGARVNIIDGPRRRSTPKPSQNPASNALTRNTPTRVSKLNEPSWTWGLPRPGQNRPCAKCLLGVVVLAPVPPVPDEFAQAQPALGESRERGTTTPKRPCAPMRDPR